MEKSYGTKVQALNQNQTCYLISCLPHYNVFGYKWVYKLKYNPNRSIQHLKAWLVPKGFHQTLGVDFSKTFSLVIKPITVCIILAIVVTMDWKIQLYVNNVFLNRSCKKLFSCLNLKDLEFLRSPNMYANYIKHCMNLNKHHMLGLKNYVVLSSIGVLKS